LVDITFPKWRNESIKAMGNSIVPQVVFQIFKTINEYENKQIRTSECP
jgi:DNA (cytosine-5)-methyltransferase 1